MNTDKSNIENHIFLFLLKSIFPVFRASSRIHFSIFIVCFSSNIGTFAPILITEEEERYIMSGYNGYSMSNNAMEAYNQGLCPASKIGKYPSPLIKKFCPFVEWHHCSKNYNKVYFYDPKTVDEVFKNNPLAKQALEEYYKKETKIYKNCVVEWIEWSGSFKNPKKKFKKEENCLVEVTNSWANITLSNGLKFRKKLTTKGFSFTVKE